MNIPYEKDNKERIPFTHYLEEFQALDPETASLRSGIPYDKDKKVFTLRMLGKEFLISWPEFEVRRADETDTQYAAILEGVPAKIMAIRMIANGIAAAPTGKYLTYREVPWGTVYLQQFTGRCISRLAFSYGNRLADFCAVMERMGAKNCPWEMLPMSLSLSMVILSSLFSGPETMSFHHLLRSFSPIIFHCHFLRRIWQWWEISRSEP